MWCDDPSNHDELAVLLSSEGYLNCPAKVIGARLGGSVDYGDGRLASGMRGVTFSARNANYPQAKYAVWWLSQFRLLKPADPRRR